MFQLFIKGGNMMWLLLIIFLINLVLIVKKSIELFGKENLSRQALKAGLNAIPFWGSVSLILGFLWHFWGLMLAMSAIAEANDVSPSIVANGLAISMISIIFGILIFLLSGIAWLILKWQSNKRLNEI
jgi:biopolymer transport protein ExbB/TolQ